MARQKIAGGREIIFRHGLRSGSEHSSAEPCLIGNHRLANRSIDAAAFFLAGCRMAKRFTKAIVNPLGIL